jgi:hypothetical protein
MGFFLNKTSIIQRAVTISKVLKLIHVCPQNRDFKTSIFLHTFRIPDAPKQGYSHLDFHALRCPKIYAIIPGEVDADRGERGSRFRPQAKRRPCQQGSYPSETAFIRRSRPEKPDVEITVIVIETTQQKPITNPVSNQDDDTTAQCSFWPSHPDNTTVQCCFSNMKKAASFFPWQTSKSMR